MIAMACRHLYNFTNDCMTFVLLNYQNFLFSSLFSALRTTPLNKSHPSSKTRFLPSSYTAALWIIRMIWTRVYMTFLVNKTRGNTRLDNQNGNFKMGHFHKSKFITCGDSKCDLGSITSRCSGKEPALLPFSGRVDQTRESGGNRA